MRWPSVLFLKSIIFNTMQRSPHPSLTPNQSLQQRRATTRLPTSSAGVPHDLADPSQKEQHNLTRESITEKEMLSHQTIRELLLKSANKVVSHEINKVHPETQLYRGRAKTQEKLSSQPSVSVSHLSAQKKEVIHEIYKEMKAQTFTWAAGHSPVSNPKAKGERYSHCKSVSLSGLTTYNFHSVKARRRIAYDPARTDHEVAASIAEAQARANCSLVRTAHIHARTVHANHLHRSLTHLVSQTSELSTEEYLAFVRAEQGRNSAVYGESFKDYGHVSRVMAKEGVSQETAEFSVAQIKLSCRPSRPGKPQRRRRQLRTEAEFEARRFPVKGRHVMAHGLAFQ